MITLEKRQSGQFELILEKSFDFESHKEFRQCMKDALDAKVNELLINFNKVEYIDSSALGMLMLARHESEEKHFSIKLTNINEGHVKDVLQLVKFDQLFSMN